MNKKQYLAMRKQLMDEAQALIDAGKAAEAEEKMKEVAALDDPVGCHRTGTGKPEGTER